MANVLALSLFLFLNSPTHRVTYTWTFDWFYIEDLAALRLHPDEKAHRVDWVGLIKDL